MTEIVQARIPYRMDAYPIAREKIFAQPNFAGVMDQAINLCAFDNDKQAADKLKIDPGLLSRRKNGGAPWQVDDMRKVIDRSQTLIPLSWLAHQYGHALVMLETEAERRERAANERIAELEMKNRVLVDALNGKT